MNLFFNLRQSGWGKTFLLCLLLVIAGAFPGISAPTSKVASKTEALVAEASGSQEVSLASGTDAIVASSPGRILDISQLKTDSFTLKKKGFEDAGQQLGKEVDNLGGRMASHTTEWLNSEAGLGITFFKLLLGVLSFLFLLFFTFLMRKLIVSSQKKYDLSTSTLKELVEKADNWIAPILEALRPPICLFVWMYGGLTIIAFLFSHVSEGDEIFWIPATAGNLAEIGGFAAFFWTIFRITQLVEIKLQIWAETTSSHWDNILVAFVGKCLRFILPLMALIFSLPFFDLSPQITEFFQRVVSIALIGSIAWILIQLVRVVERVMLEPVEDHRKEDFQARKIFTQVHILKKVLFTIIWVLSFSLMLMVFDSVRQLGTSIMASAGVLGIIVGFAAQKTIATLLAGIQIAVSQPVRIDDVVIVEGEWGWIEEITLTYVVVKIWDLRRLVLPINYFIEKPFQNWTRTSAKILGSIFFYVDYKFPVDELREPLKQIVSASKNWDGDVCGLQVTDMKPAFLELRALISSENSSKAWDLRCEVREKLLSHIQKNYPHCLPLTRARIEPEASFKEQANKEKQ